jgi:hypothetical protein
VVVGSAKLGFSIVPDKRYRAFGETSDIDVVLCSSALFDLFWEDVLVDGQQRVTTLQQYFTGSPDLVLHGSVKSYSQLTKEEKEAFLQYDVVVRDLGHVEIDIIRSVFQRINATRYALNAMEIHNSRYEGEFKAFGEELAQRPFFENHRVFSASEIRRMQDVRFALAVGVTVLSTYFNRDDELEEYLGRYNDEFLMRDDLLRELDSVFEFIEQLRFAPASRLWKKADLFTAIVELHKAICKRRQELTPGPFARTLESFYAAVDDPEARANPENDASQYYKAALQATNDRSSRVKRGEVFEHLIEQSLRTEELI